MTLTRRVYLTASNARWCFWLHWWHCGEPTWHAVQRAYVTAGNTWSRP